MQEKKSAQTDVVFVSRDACGQDMRLSGVSAEMLSRPERIRQVMELLGLPEGTVARVIHTTEDVIVR